MDPIGAIITGIRTIGGALIPPIKKKYLDQPKVYVILDGHVKAGRFSGPQSFKNDFSKPINFLDEIRFHKLQWNYNLIFRNNSEHVAYNLKLINPNPSNLFILDKKIDSLRPLIQNSEISQRIKIEKTVEGTGAETYNASNELPDFLSLNKFILEYTNVKQTKFYTIFDWTKQEDLRNKFVKKL
jgi:hypothetical protein